MRHPTWKMATHLTLLVRAFNNTEGDVLEMGTGYFSTLILRWLCEMSGRTLYSFESQESWYERAIKNQGPNHKVIYCSSWDTADIERHWGLAFIDHGPNPRRHIDIERLANYADVLVIHDTEPEVEKQYKYYRIFPLFKYRFDFTKYIPWTSAVSNKIDVTKWNN
jgi:hypothetical protein